MSNKKRNRFFLYLETNYLKRKMENYKHNCILYFTIKIARDLNMVTKCYDMIEKVHVFAHRFVPAYMRFKLLIDSVFSMRKLYHIIFYQYRNR